MTGDEKGARMARALLNNSASKVVCGACGDTGWPRDMIKTGFGYFCHDCKAANKIPFGANAKKAEAKTRGSKAGVPKTFTCAVCEKELHKGEMTKNSENKWICKTCPSTPNSSPAPVRKIVITPKYDNVDHPSHYTNGPKCPKCGETIECITITEIQSFARGNAMKYLWRAGAKDPEKEVEDLKKAKWYIEREIERLQK